MNILRKYIQPHYTISIIGTAKNAGKTTVLNQIIKEFKKDQIAITSIGLDGEKVDSVTNKPKPRIKVHKSMLIATAIDCLDECTFNYVLHEKTKIFTALGEIVVVEATNTGLALVAGPSRKSEMIKLVKTLKKYNPINIFIDGALFRKSIAGTTVSDAMILSTGASYNEDINIVVKDTKTLVDQLNLPIFKGRFYDLLLGIKFNALINTRKSMFRLGSLWDDNNKDVIKEEINEEIRYLYLKGALTDTVIHQLVDIRHKIKKLTIILKDPTHIICDYGNFALLKKMNVDVKVLNQIELLFISYNPHSPIYEDFNDQQFYKLLEENIDVECINVLKDTE